MVTHRVSFDSGQVLAICGFVQPTTKTAIATRNLGRMERCYTEPMADALWLFGYGSLIWRPDFPFEQQLPGRLRGWTRRFWQGSTDHRGVPGAPGRVVTLVPRSDATCGGVVFRITPSAVDTVLARLDHREKGGYQRHILPIELLQGVVDRALVYVATRDNPNYLGPASIDAIVEQVAHARGPSGDNVEYVFKLADALRALNADDPHVFEIDRRLRAKLTTSSARVEPC